MVWDILYVYICSDDPDDGFETRWTAMEYIWDRLDPIIMNMTKLMLMFIKVLRLYLIIMIDWYNHNNWDTINEYESMHQKCSNNGNQFCLSQSL